MVALFTAGGIIIDNVVAADGTVNRGAMGGNAVYSAAGARLWLDEVGLVGIVPRNYPAAFLERLARGGIDTEGVAVVAEDVTLAEWFVYAPDGSRRDQLHASPDDEARLGLDRQAIAPQDVALLAARLAGLTPGGRGFGPFRRDHPITFDHVPARFRTARAVHLPTSRPDAHRALATALKAAGLLVSVDPGANAPVFAAEASCPPADFLLPSEKELAVLEPGADRAAGVARLAHRTGAVVAAKLGQAGAIVATTHGTLLVPACRVSARDPTGAGDAFCGGFLAGFLLTGDPVAAVCHGTVAASFAVESFGPFHLLEADRAEARQRLEVLMARLERPPIARPHVA